MKSLIVVFLTLLALLSLKVDSGNAFDCEEAKRTMLPCAEYLMGNDGIDPPTSCCNGCVDLKSSAPTKDDRRAACECMKEAASHFINLREDLGESLPKKCGVEIGFTINKDMDCNGVP